MRVLIAESDAQSRLAIKRSVQKLGFECEEAESGEQAWDLFVAIKPHVVLADGTARGRDRGFLFPQVRAHHNENYPYYVVLTSAESRGDTDAILELGADDVLVKPIDPQELRARLTVASRVCALHARKLELERELERMKKEVYEDGRRDPLTKIGNRLRMHEDLEGLAARAARYGQQFCIALCDIDFFKKYNETCGHAAGDETLKMVARTLASFARSGDTAYRFGGEEFLVVLPSANIEGATIGMDRRRRAVERLAIPHPSRGEPAVITMSVGIAMFDPNEPSPIDTALKRADSALFFAKSSGRNRVAVYREMEGQPEAASPVDSLPPDAPSPSADSI